jgi:hypothetical protein
MNKEPAIVKLSSLDGKLLTIRVNGYEFSSATGDIFDKNWYICDIMLQEHNLKCKLSGSNLLATEIAALLDYFKKLKSEAIKEFTLEPIEPYFGLKVETNDKNPDILKISGFIMIDAFDNEVKFMFFIKKDGIDTIVKQLQNILNRFPVRK